MRAPARRPSSVTAMLEPRSIAVVGASARPGSFGRQMILTLLQGGYQGAVYPVNPRYEEIEDLACYPSQADVSGRVDLVLLGVSNVRLEEQVQAAASAGASAVAIFASGYEEPRPGRPLLTDRVAGIARGSGMAVCGGNCMGFLNLQESVWACGFPMPPQLRAGGITFISHSGSAFSAMLHNDRRLSFNLVVSSGQELVTSSADYLEYAAGHESTRVIAMFLETIRAPVEFGRGLERAAERDIPVVILKVGRTRMSKELVTAHSGALAGEDGAYEAFFDAHGVLRVDSLDEMADTIELLACGRRAGPGGLGAVHDSGGERAMFIDAGLAAGVSLPAVNVGTRSRLADVLEEGLVPVNPLDAWGTGNDYEDIFIESMHALLDDRGIAALALCVDLTTEAVDEGGYVRAAKEVFAARSEPVALLSNMSSAVDARDAGSLRSAGVPVLEGTYSGLRAFKHLFEYRDQRARAPHARKERGVDRGVRDRWRARLAGGEPFQEAEALELLAGYSVPVIGARQASCVEDALDAAEKLGRPVALKTAAPGIQHKTDAGGVCLGLRTSEELVAAYADMSARLGPEVVVAAMARPGVELALGVVTDAQFGSLVMVAAGGVLIELIEDRAFALPPLDESGAERLVGRLSIKPLLEGVRGAPPVDFGALYSAVAALSRLAHDLGPHLGAVDVNPLIAGPWGCVAVDALVIPAAEVPTARS